MKRNKDKDYVHCASSSADTEKAVAAENAATAAASNSEEQSETDILLQQVAQWRDTAMRAQAEFDNTKKRLATQQATALARASERVITALIPVIDDIEFGINHAEESSNDMLEGLQAIHAKLTAVLRSEKVEVVDPLDQPFDHNTAQAVQMVEDATKPDQTVVQVLQKGYVMGKDGENMRVLRPAMVLVSTNPDNDTSS